MYLREQELKPGIPSAHVRILPPWIAKAGTLFFITLSLVIVTRWPLLPSRLYSFDTVNLALALEDFDPTRHQPQPPGYPLFVAEARLLYWLLGTPERTFTA